VIFMCFIFPGSQPIEHEIFRNDVIEKGLKLFLSFFCLFPNPNPMRKHLVIFIVLMTALAPTSKLAADNKPLVREEKDKSAKETIDISEISIRSSKVFISTREDIRDLISAQAISKLKTANTLLFASIDADLLSPVNLKNPMVNIRYLEGRRIRLQMEQRKINDHQAELSATISGIEGLKMKLLRENILWKNTRSFLLRDSLISLVPPKITTVIMFLDSAIMLTSNKINSLADILDKTISVGVQIDLAIEQVKGQITVMQRNAFTRDHPPFFSMNAKAPVSKEIESSFSNLWHNRIRVLGHYLGDHAGLLYFTLFLFFGFIWFFMNLRKRLALYRRSAAGIYDQAIMKIVSQPISTSLLLTLFLTSLLFPDRPMIFREFSIYLIALPLLNLIRSLIENRFRGYLAAFAGIILVYTSLIFFNIDTRAYRILAMVIAIADTTLLAHFFWNFRRNTGMVKRYRKLIFLFTLLHILLSFAALIANIAGFLILAELILSAVFNNIFFGVLLFLMALIFNGLIVIGIDSEQAKKINLLKNYELLISSKSIALVNFTIVFIWLITILKSFRISGYLYDLMIGFLTRKITIGSASFSLDVIVIFFIMIYLSVLIAKFIRILLEEDVLNRYNLSKGLPHTIAMGAKYILIIAGFFLAVNAAGIPIDKLTIVLGAFSVGIGFGLQNIFNNMVSGLILLFERPIQLGDTVQVGQLTGNVKSIDLRSSNIRTFDGAEVIVPNGQLISNEVINWTLSDPKRRIEIAMGVSYNSDPAVVQRLLLDILFNHGEIIKDPEPVVFFAGLGDSSLDFTLLFWIGDYAEGRRIRSEVYFKAFEVFKENNIEIPFPQRDIHVRTIDREAFTGRKEESPGNNDHPGITS
jgi:potassium-dependent mechanosensitive channel